MKNQKNHEHTSDFHLREGVTFLLAPVVKYPRYGTAYIGEVYFVV
jgi:hypothetical protein